MLLAETMTRCGSIAALNRHKMEELGSSLLQRASFEQTLPVLEDAAFFNRADPLTGSLERQIVGLPLRVGTGLVGIVEDPNAAPEEEQVVLAPLKSRSQPQILIPKLRPSSGIGSGNTASAPNLLLAPMMRSAEWTPHVDMEVIPKLQHIVDRVSISAKLYEAALEQGQNVTLRAGLFPMSQQAFEAALTRLRAYCGWDSAPDDWVQSTKVEWDGGSSTITHLKTAPEREHYKSSCLVSTRIGWPIDTYVFEAKATRKEFLNMKSVPAALEPRQVTIRQRQVFNKDGWSYICCQSWTAGSVLKAEAELLTTAPKYRISIQTLDIQNRLYKIENPQSQIVSKWWNLVT
jgi:hypothetical protein